LGRFVLQTYDHRPDWGDLSQLEIATLGINLQRINSSLRHYWIKKFDDYIDQIYIAYFNDKPYKNTDIPKDIYNKLHVHMHILVRTHDTRKELIKKQIRLKDALGWHFIDYINKFPKIYQISSNGDDKVKQLMEYLNLSLSIKNEG